MHSSNTKKLIGCNKGATRVFNDVLRVFQDILEKVSDDGNDIFEKVSDDAKDILVLTMKH